MKECIYFIVGDGSVRNLYFYWFRFDTIRLVICWIWLTIGRRTKEETHITDYCIYEGIYFFLYEVVGICSTCYFSQYVICWLQAAPVYSAPGYLVCAYTKDTATGLAAAAFVFLLFGQILITAATSCFCCGKATYRPGFKRVCSVLLLIFSWYWCPSFRCLFECSMKLNIYHNESLQTSSFSVAF